MDEEKRFMSIKDAANYLGVSDGTVRNYEKMGLIKPLRTIGGHRRYDMDMLENVLELYGKS